MAAEPVPPAGRPDPPPWPAKPGQRVVFLLDASSALEERLLRRFVAEARPAETPVECVDALCIPASRRPGRRRRRMPARLDALLATPDDPVMAPLRVAWRPPERDGERRVRFRDLLLGDPRDPGPLRQRWIQRRHPDRCRIVAGEPAPASDLRRRWRDAGGADASETAGLPTFVVRQAILALERAERALRGTRYKVPRLVHEDILSRPAFRGALARLAGETGEPEKKLRARAERYLREIAATHSPLVIDLVANLIRWLYRQGYGETLHYDRSQLEALYALAQRHPVVFLPTHKSNMDHLALQYALHENGLPPNHTAGGINMNFFPVGPLVRRSGVFFIRRSFRDNPLYKLVLRSYIDYLVEKRFSLEWYVEGGRSRTGKLLPPQFGLLAYVVDAYRRAKSDDLILIPVSIAYDQIQDVGSYAAEQRGAPKQKESFGWFVGVVRALRRRYGAIHLRFGEPLSLQGALGPPTPGAEPDPDEKSLALQKLAFEVAVRINRVTPITPTSLVTLTLLGTGDRALSVVEARVALANLLTYVSRRKLPTTTDLAHLETDEGVRATLQQLADNEVVSCFDEGPDPVYLIVPDQHLTAAYYRNTIIHFFVTGAICELALIGVDETPDPVSVFWDECMRLRDLLKFEFFFAEKEAFREEVRQELALHDPTWEARLSAGGSDAHELLRSFKPFSAHRTLRPFLEAYAVVADALAASDPEAPVDEPALIGSCLSLGRQYQLQLRIRRAESVSKALFGTALRLARNRGLCDPGAPGLRERRSDFVAELRDAVRRVDAVDALAASRRAGLIE